MALWKILTGGITELFTGWFEVKKQKQQIEGQIQQQRLQGSDDYDLEALRQKQHSWSDEYLMLIHTFPWWGYIIPSDGLTTRLDILWSKMSILPEWWWFCYAGMIISTFGLRFMHKKIIRGKLNDRQK